MVAHRDRLARLNAELVEASLLAHGDQLVVLHEGQGEDDLVRDMEGVLTSFCARLYGKRSARNRALKALNCAKHDVGPQGLGQTASRTRSRAGGPPPDRASGAGAGGHHAADPHPAARLGRDRVALGANLGRLARADLARHSAAGLKHDQKVWAARKRALTAQSSSRWAAAITQASNDAYCATARRNQRRQQRDLTRAMATLTEKLERPCHAAPERRDLHAGQAGRHLGSGYRSGGELAMKRARLQHLRARLANLDLDVEAGRVHITLGGKRRLRHRLHGHPE